MEKIRKLILRVRTWIKQNPREAAFLAIVLTLAALLRLWRISDYMTFLGDEGRDVIVVRRLLVNADPILIGPGTSIGSMYLGPLYYYMMALPLLLANFSPVGPSVQIALLGIVTVAMVYFIGKEWFGKITGVVAASLYAISPIVIVYSRSSWNPNIMPFFALLAIYSIWRIWKRKEFKWLAILGISFAFMLQSHYLGLLLIPVIGVFWLLTLKDVFRNKTSFKDLIKKSLVGAAIFAFLMSPLVIFDLRHGWMNFSAIRKFFAERQTTVSARPWNAIPKIPQISQEIVTRLVTGKDKNVGKYATSGLGVFLLLLILRYKKLSDKEKSAFILLGAWLGFALLGLGLYKQQIYDHYYGFFFPAPFFLVGWLVQRLAGFSRGSLLALVIILGFVVVNFLNSPLRDAPNMQLPRSRMVAQKIRQEAGGNKFNLAVVAERNYEDGYQYFLEVWGEEVIEIDAQKPETITEQLFVVCELPKEKCDPTHNPKAQVASFGWSKVENAWEEGGAVLFKLVHTK